MIHLPFKIYGDTGCRTGTGVDVGGAEEGALLLKDRFLTISVHGHPVIILD